ncbi:MAG: hypothetical protein HY924_15735 [Elusimicrobia bacterium]|nr:hypothetical protein [Elusimicrobiota bacterium]
MPSLLPEASPVAARIERLLGRKVRSLGRLRGGRNSRVYLASADGDQRFIVKRYFRHPSDRRDRLGVEFGGLKFLWKRGMRCIPEPIAADPAGGLALYRQVDGSPIRGSNVAEEDIRQAVRFLADLKALSRLTAARALPPASEACFSVAAIVRNLRLRLAALTPSSARTPSHAALRDFVKRDLEPSVHDFGAWSRSRLTHARISYAAPLKRAERTLSPSDFGFHNALRDRSGGIIFLDFEYFGWDDPAKAISDFLLHPAMRLCRDHKVRFVEGCLDRLDATGHLAARLSAVFPLFGLKWCMILLNEFVPRLRLRRDFAAGRQASEDVLDRQLEKARRMLCQVKRDMDPFRYHG